MSYVNEQSVSPAAISTALEIPPARTVALAHEVDDLMIAELAASFSRWGRTQLYGLCVLAALAVSLAIWGPGLAKVIAIIGLLPGMILGNYLTDRANVHEFETIGLAPELARRLLRKTYTVPSAYLMFPAMFSKSTRAKHAIGRIIIAALRKC